MRKTIALAFSAVLQVLPAGPRAPDAERISGPAALWTRANVCRERDRERERQRQRQRQIVRERERAVAEEDGTWCEIGEQTGVARQQRDVSSVERT